MRRVLFCFKSICFTRTISNCGMPVGEFEDVVSFHLKKCQKKENQPIFLPSVIQTTSGISASTASSIALAAAEAGT